MAHLGFIQIFQNYKKNQNIELKIYIIYCWEIRAKFLLKILYLKTSRDQYKDIYLKARILFDLSEEILKILSNKGLIKDDYQESIAEKTKLRRQRNAKKNRRRSKNFSSRLNAQ